MVSNWFSNQIYKQLLTATSMKSIPKHKIYDTNLVDPVTCFGDNQLNDRLYNFNDQIYVVAKLQYQLARIYIGRYITLLLI